MATLHPAVRISIFITLLQYNKHLYVTLKNENLKLKEKAININRTNYSIPARPQKGIKIIGHCENNTISQLL